jgi:hypothetical protein
MVREAMVSRGAVTVRPAIGRVPDVGHRAGVMIGAKGAMATGHGGISEGLSQTRAIVLRVGPEKGALHSSRALSKSGRSGRGATAPTASDRVVRAVGPGGGTTTAHKGAATGQDGRRSGTSLMSGALVPKTARPRRPLSPGLAQPNMP